MMVSVDHSYLSKYGIWYKLTFIDVSIMFPQVSLRSEVFKSIVQGNILNAIDLVNNIDEEILQKNTQEFFHLRLQWLIELFRDDETLKAISYAQHHVYPLISQDKKVKGEITRQQWQELEDVMGLILSAKNVKKKHLVSKPSLFSR